MQEKFICKDCGRELGGHEFQWHKQWRRHSCKRCLYLAKKERESREAEDWVHYQQITKFYAKQPKFIQPAYFENEIYKTQLESALKFANEETLKIYNGL